MSITLWNWPSYYFLGLDLNVYDSSQFSEIQGIEEGLHLITWARRDIAGLVSGAVVSFEDRTNLLLKFDERSESVELEFVDGIVATNGPTQQGRAKDSAKARTIPFRPSTDWNRLSRFISLELLGRLFSKSSKNGPAGSAFLIDTSTYSNTDQASSAAEQLPIMQPGKDDFVLHIGHERSIQAYDKSFLFQRLVHTSWNNDSTNALGEFSLAFLLYLELSHYGSYLQWHNLIRLILQSYQYAREEAEYFTTFLYLLRSQLEYMNDKHSTKELLPDEGIFAQLFEQLHEEQSEESFAPAVYTAIRALEESIRDNVSHPKSTAQTSAAQSTPTFSEMFDEGNEAELYEMEHHETVSSVIEPNENTKHTLNESN
ncbi:U5 snRNP-associated protein Aar2 [Schizosaccharomyces japonicus yFS275]|uniref:U5 snRNP-associated protein Aar2 n=1 Tax=Schizosaccharomyces japonicus (strain yFS275 / FY16936) TaxID=402676 RepID=B6JY88_SCHJY|nr:U5 snRNP-associated protein Aar2 [Schizosaccharomyces japonicus yFS275]EEB06506.1 U5 snRNP-associated protein Aar2 [Schizosaccharomyces japonicus yFS275]